MGAIVALGRCMAIGVDIEGVVGAGLHTRLAADTTRTIEINNAVRAFVERLCGTNSDTGRVVAVVTTIYQKIAARIGEFPLLNVLNPGAIDTDWHVVFGFAGHGTGVTANTLALVNHKSIFGHACVPLIKTADASRKTSLLFLAELGTLIFL